MPVVSVIFSTYNHARYLVEAIESVLIQTFTDYEIIVVDDGSTDNTNDVLQPFIKASKIRYYYQENQGQSAARNFGIKFAEGKYISFHDADDLSAPTKLKKQVAYLDTHPEVALVHSGYSKFDDEGNNLGYRDTSKISGWVYPDILLDWSVLIGMTCVMVRVSVLAEVGGFDPVMLRAQDLDLWRRIAKQYPLGVIPEALSQYRVHPSNLATDLITYAVPYFKIYLEKAFTDDPNLGERFQRHALANLNKNIAHNYLARGNNDSMQLVREYSLRAIKYDPFQWGAYLGWVGSWLEPNLKNRFLKLWWKYRYRKL